MRVKVFAAFLFVAALDVNVSKAQVYRLPTPVPQVTAAAADWQIRGEPIFYAGEFYYAAGPSVFFDGNVMKRTGQHRGVALYEDSTLEPYSIVYVPIGRNLMRPYERWRAGQLAGTVGSRTPSFPVERDVEVSARTSAVTVKSATVARTGRSTPTTRRSARSR